MKLLIIATVILVAAADVKYQIREDIAEQWEDIYKPHKQECIQESGVNEDDVHDIFKRGHYPNKMEFKCYLKCVGVKLNFINNDGSFNEANAHSTRNTASAADLDTIEHGMKFVEHIKDPCEKFYMYVITCTSKVGARYPPRHKIH